MTVCSSTAPLEPAMLAALSPVDYGVLLLYLGALLGVGAYFSSRQKTTTQFFLGDRSVSWLPLGLSLAVAWAAGATFAELPGLAYDHGLKCWIIPASLWLVLPLAVFLLAPLARGLSLESLYQFLEHRFDARVRLAVCLIFLAWRWCWMTAMICLSCEALALASGWPWPTWMLIVPLGLIATLYTFLGGLRAVIAGGTAHAGILLAGVAIIIAAVWWNLGGNPPQVAAAAEKLGRMSRVDLSFDWTSGWALWVLLPHWFFAWLALGASDQVSGQRLLGARNVNTARTAWLTSTLYLSLLLPALIYAGLCLLAFYQTHPREMRPAWVVNVDGLTRTTIERQEGRELLDPRDPAHAVTWENIDQLVKERRVLRPNDKQPFTTADELIDPDQNRLLVEKLAMRKSFEGTLGGEYVVSRRAPREMLPHFVATQLPWGLAGLAVAALVAACLAAIDASLSGLALTLVVDLHRRCGLGRRWLARRLGKDPAVLSAADELQLARPLTLVLGGAAVTGAVLAALLVEEMHLPLAIAGVLGGPLLAVFLLGLLTRRATAAAALTALVAGVAGAVCLIPQAEQLAEAWHIVFAALFTFVLGYVLSFVLGRRKTNQELRGLVAGCGTIGIRPVERPAPRITLPSDSSAASDEGIRWK